MNTVFDDDLDWDDPYYEEGVEYYGEPASVELPAVVAATLADKPIPVRTHEEVVKRLPYGVWICADGREVMFNRSYAPMWERASAGAETKPADPNEWVKDIIQQKFFYTDWTSPKRKPATAKRLRAVLRQWGVKYVVRPGKAAV
jgi:hypothetical protein